MVMSDKSELIPVHCNMLKGYVEGGTSTEVTFTFSPTAPGVRAVFSFCDSVLKKRLYIRPLVVTLPKISFFQIDRFPNRQFPKLLRISFNDYTVFFWVRDIRS